MKNYFITWAVDGFRYVEKYRAANIRAALAEFEADFHVDRITIISVKRGV